MSDRNERELAQLERRDAAPKPAPLGELRAGERWTLLAAVLAGEPGPHGFQLRATRIATPLDVYRFGPRPRSSSRRGLFERAATDLLALWEDQVGRVETTEDDELALHDHPGGGFFIAPELSEAPDVVIPACELRRMLEDLRDLRAAIATIERAGCACDETMGKAIAVRLCPRCALRRALGLADEGGAPFLSDAAIGRVGGAVAKRRKRPKT